MKITTARITEAYEQISVAALVRMQALYDDPDALTYACGRPPHKPVELGLVSKDWNTLTTLGEAVVEYHETL